MEDIMKAVIQLTTVTIFAAGLFSLFSPAFATTKTREAMAVCAKKPNCQMSVGTDGVVITVNPGTNGTVIVCPIKNGPCGVLPSRTNSFGNGQGNNAQHNAQQRGGGPTG
jgi:hypothetical protein